MNDAILTSKEKARLSDYAREVVERNARAGAKLEPAAEAGVPDAFSVDALRERLKKLELEMSDLGRRVDTNLSALLTAMQRIEARAAQTSGELRAAREEIDALAGDAAYARVELVATAKDYSSALNGEIARLVERLDTMHDGTVAETSKKEHATNGSTAPGVRRDG